MTSLHDLIDDLAQDPAREPIASELSVLQSIYGDESISPWRPASEQERVLQADADTLHIRFQVSVSLPSPHEDIIARVLVSLPPAYPSTAPPQLQLLSRYIGPFGVDPDLFGSVLKTYISVSGVEWIPDAVCVFDGLSNVLERITAWYESKLSVQKAGELLRDTKESVETTQNPGPKENPTSFLAVALPPGVKLFEAEPIIDRKSVFVGRACKISDPAQVPLVLSYLMCDRRIARAAHPIINAWRCKVGKVLHQDNDDDGETAAGGRLAHLLQILNVDDVLVIVTRYWGGILLGPDRFKHINQAARDVLELGGFIETKKSETRGKGAKR
ncbi:UPF0029-domain-containing protein [Amylostereum chailletii]|nr:UPF0029-domain-containing protein [Amylostereum chailletii]